MLTIFLSIFFTNLYSEDLATYYSLALDKTGVELKSALHEIIDDHPAFTYDEVYDILKDLDADPENPDNVVLIYTRRSQPSDTRGNCNDCRTREHTWPSSHGGFKSDQYPAYTDLHHLRACDKDKTVNSSQGTKDYDDGGDIHHEAALCKADTLMGRMSGQIPARSRSRRAIVIERTLNVGEESEWIQLREESPKRNKLSHIFSQFQRQSHIFAVIIASTVRRNR